MSYDGLERMVRLSRVAGNLSLAFTFLIIVGFYFWTACTSGVPGTPARALNEHYGLLAQDDLSGHLSLPNRTRGY